MTLGERLKTYRELANLSQTQLAEMADVNRPIITMLESGRQEDTYTQTALRLAHALGLSLGQLVGEEWPPRVAETRKRRAKKRTLTGTAKG